MKEIIEEILIEEKKARERVAHAKEKAKEIRLAAEEKARKLIEDTRKSAQDGCKAIIEKAELEAALEREEMLKKTAHHSQNIWKEKKKEIEETVDILFDRVIEKKDSNV